MPRRAAPLHPRWGWAARPHPAARAAPACMPEPGPWPGPVRAGGLVQQGKGVWLPGGLGCHWLRFRAASRQPLGNPGQDVRVAGGSCGGRHANHTGFLQGRAVWQARPGRPNIAALNVNHRFRGFGSPVCVGRTLVHRTVGKRGTAQVVRDTDLMRDNHPERFSDLGDR